jgi:peptidylprolyl isomerase
VKLPAISPKVPALPAGAPCFKPLYTIVTNPPFKLTDVSPMEDPGLREALKIQGPETITLSYADSKIGAGALAAPNKWYTIKYSGYLEDGTEFDASAKHPDMGGTFSFQQGPQGPSGQRQVVLGMDTGLFGMRVGGKRRIFIPWELAYGPDSHLTIPAKSDLIFDVELVAQSDSDPTPKPPATPTPAAAPASPTAPASTAPPPSAAPASTAPASAPPAATKP